ncbi:hypothetical protein ACMU_14080 [Actibacterium mucosum KCTC 23349]|uniref:Maleylacetoacetate isomerase n=1 Tax=Actibacterium mucosum KCTC 23349 TaxID=1454373 RepID=A0A037ZFK6_9RHOB|nr:maleylacetoacetate isomerase [Actibacterium mucosum]KAJ54888.1 hypothetical protein ACMU_14080 [Actibacterium mucosum KCTC 23349]
MTVTLYSAAQNSAGERVRIALNLKGVAYDYVPMATLSRAERRARNPQGLMPTLQVGDAYITQSLAALEYIAAELPGPPLLPPDPVLAAQSRSVALAVCAEMHAITVRRVRRYLADEMQQDDTAIAAWYAHWTAKTFAALELQLAPHHRPGAFAFADYPTFADIALVPQMANARRFDCALDPYPTLQQIEAACTALPAFQAAQPARQPDYSAPPG